MPTGSIARASGVDAQAIDAVSELRPLGRAWFPAFMPIWYDPGLAFMGAGDDGLLGPLPDLLPCPAFPPGRRCSCR